MAQDLKRLKAELESAREAANNGGMETVSASEMPKFQVKQRRQLKGHFGKVYALHWAGPSEEDSLVTASQDGKLIVWNALTTFKRQAIPLRSSWVMTCAFEQKQCNLVACGGLDNLCSIYRIDQESATNRAAYELQGHDGYLSCCRFIDNKNIISSSGDSTCIYWDVEAQVPKTTFADHTADVMSVSINPTDPNVFVSGSCDASSLLWDIRTGKSVMSFLGHESDINAVNFFPSGDAFGTASDDSSCRLFDIRAGQEVNVFASDNILCGITSVCFSKSGRVLFAGYDDFQCQAWDTLKGNAPRPIQSLAPHDNRVSCLDASSKGNALCTGSWDTLLRVFA